MCYWVCGLGVFSSSVYERKGVCVCVCVCVCVPLRVLVSCFCLRFL